ncbi:MAG TPA: DEAD/DEAH box helicase, partial [Patescibacteria group bacterium]|nr:DEAD/DEAH box helicase [Patescibacteria group bacterium]
LPTDRRIVVERFRDEIGDWRLVLLTPFGGRVHAPWAMAIEARLRARLGAEVSSIWSDDGIAIHLPDGDVEGVEDDLFPEADGVEDLVVAAVGGTALFAARFRENAARALLLPRRRPGTRTPLWQQRRRAADLLAVAGRYGSFPILVETYRECLADVFDLPALRDVLRGVERREVAVHRVVTPRATPFASSLLFNYVAAFMYEGDAPLAERRAQALALDRGLLRELLGQEELRELLDPAALEETELERQALSDERRAESVDQVADLLRRLGDLTAAEVAARSRGAAAAEWLATLAATRRAIVVWIGGEARWIAAEDAARYRDATGAQPPPGTPAAFLGETRAALGSLLARWARTHGPFLAAEPARRWGLPVGIVEEALARLAEAGSLLRGEFRPGGAEREWCDPDVLRLLRRRSLARLRREVEPADQAALARFLPAWQGVAAAPVRGTAGADGAPPPHGQAALERLAEVVDQLAGVPIPASVLERDVLTARVPGYQPRLLDELGALGEVAWVGCGRLGRDDGRIALFRPGRGDSLRAALAESRRAAAGRPDGRRHEAIRDWLARHGASFYRGLFAAGGGSEREVLDALWDLVWAGEVTNDTFAPLRALRWKRPSADRRRGPPRLAALGPPEAAGRWSLVETGGAPWAPGATERLHALALALLDRHGVLTREAVMSEGIAGGFAAVYPVLRALEEAGRIRRGYFVDGLGAAQFALGGAIDRLRAARDPDAARPRVDLLAAADPAQPYGAALPWPRRGEADRRPFQRGAGAYVVVVDGVAVLYVERGGKGLATFPAADDPERAGLALAALGGLLGDGRAREIVVSRVDGAPLAPEHPWRARLIEAGFVPGYRGLILRPHR